MVAHNGIKARLNRLEKHSSGINRFAHWTNEQILARLADIDRMIFEAVGGTSEKGYAAFCRWSDKDMPETLDGFHAECATLEGGRLKHIGTVERFAAEALGIRHA